MDKSHHINQLTKAGEFICRYESIAEAAKKTNTHATNIVKCLKGERYSVAGFRWEYVNKDLIKKRLNKVNIVHQENFYSKAQRLQIENELLKKENSELRDTVRYLKPKELRLNKKIDKLEKELLNLKRDSAKELGALKMKIKNVKEALK